MIKHMMLPSSGEPVHAMEADLRSVGEWKPTVAQAREAILKNRIVAPDFLSMMGGKVDPMAKDFLPRQNEVDLICEQSHEAVRLGRMIDFGHLSNATIKAGSARGGPLWNSDALVMPFSQPWILYHTWEEGPSVYLVSPGENPGDAFEICEFSAMTFDEAGKLLAVGDRGLFERSHNDGYAVRVIPATYRYLPGAHEFFGDTTPELAAASNLADPLMAALLILNTRNIRRETIKVKDSLNKARARSGKPPIPPYDMVHSAPYVTAMNGGNARARGVDRGGTHASPIPHIRRGHMRHYDNGKASFVRDTLVNVEDKARANFLRTHYEVKT